MDAESGQALYELRADARRPPASTTKIMTAILLLERLPLDTIVQADKSSSDTDGSSLYLRPGERLSAHDLLYAIMLRSANDACVAVAKAIAGSEVAFAEMMTRKAHEIGAVHTRFANPNGLPARDHYSTARDLATMARYAIREPLFNEVVRTRFRTIERDPANDPKRLRNRSKFLWRYAGADGIKTGYTVAAGRCFVASATRKGWRLICVVLNSPEMYEEVAKLLDYGFAGFEPLGLVEPGQAISRVPVRDGARPAVTAVAEASVRHVVRRGARPAVSFQIKRGTPAAPLAKGVAVGEATVLLDGKAVGRVTLVSGEEVGPLPPVRAATRHGWRLLATAISVVVFCYVSTRSKAPRRRRRRVETGLRDLDALRSRHR